MIEAINMLYSALGICIGGLIGHYFGWTKGHNDGWADRLKDLNCDKDGMK